MANKVFSQLTQTTVPLDSDIICIELTGGAYRHILKSDFMKDFDAVNYTESIYDNGSLASGTLTPNCDTNGNSHKVTITGNITIEAPTKALVSGQFVSGFIRIAGGDAHAVTWGATYDWGDDGAPTLTSNSIIGFFRESGDTNTSVWHKGGFA